MSWASWKCQAFKIEQSCLGPCLSLPFIYFLFFSTLLCTQGADLNGMHCLDFLALWQLLVANGKREVAERKKKGSRIWR